MSSTKKWDSVAALLDSECGVPDRRVSVADARAIIAFGVPRSCSPEEARDCAERLAKRLPTGPDTDFQAWLEDAVFIFTHYPAKDVREAVLNPMTGFVSVHRWLPGAAEIKAHLDGRVARRARIINNAKRIVARDEEARREAEDNTPERVAERMAMSKRLTDLSRNIRGMASVSKMDAIREQQSEVNAYATWLGNGDIGRGMELMIERGITEPPRNWRTEVAP